MQQDLFDSSSTQSAVQDAPVDQQIRIDALNPYASFAVAAPAGSGKTGLLTQRVLTLLAHCDEPEEILAITFTRKAAGEMQDRILHALWNALEQPQPEEPHESRTWQLARTVLERDEKREWNLLQSPHRLRVQTIDSLSRSITQQLPLASGLGAQPDTLENPEQAYRLAVRELFKLLEQDTPLQNDLAQLLRHLDNNLITVEQLLISLLAKREQWLGVLLQARHIDARAYLEDVLQEVIVEHLEQVRSVLEEFASDICLLADQAAQNLQAESEPQNRIYQLLGIVELPGTTSEAIPQWLAIADLLLTNAGACRARLTKTEGFPAGKAAAHLKNQFCTLITAIQANQPEAASLLHAVRELPPPNYDEQQWQLLASLTRILPQLAAQLMLVFKQLAATDYSAISQAALMALGDEESPTDIALQLDYRIRHILVDEFQDTASPQLELLRKLTQGWQRDDGRTLFIVGDGMQSCYGFRNANVGLFLDARKQGIGSVLLSPLNLGVNFRSQAGIVRWVNETFAQAFPQQDDISRGAVKYSPSIAFKPQLNQNAVNFYACTYASATNTNHYFGEEDEEEETNNKILVQKQEAATVIELVKKAKFENPQGSIAILVRTRSHLLHILPALTQAGLHYQATEIDSLASRMAILDLLSLTRALLNPADRIAWLAILRAPWCGLDLSDLHAVVTYDLGELNPRLEEGGYAVIWQQLHYIDRIQTLSENGKKILARVVPLLKQAWSERYRKPLGQWIEGLWLALGGPASLIDENDSDNIRSFFTLLEKHQSGGAIKDWQVFQTAIERLFAAPKADADPLLQVMTIHKSKGLEFDTVIIPGLDRRPRLDDKQLFLWQERLNVEGEKRLLLGSLAPVGNDDDKLYKFMRREAEKQQHFEATRLLYVGCTRAIKYLHLVACLNVHEFEFRSPSKHSLLHSIWRQVKDLALPPLEADIENITHEVPAPQLGTAPGLQHLVRLPPCWQPPTLADVDLLQPYRGHEFSTNAAENPLNIPEIETLNARLARHSGTLIHRVLQSIVENSLITHTQKLVATDFLRAQKPFWKIQLRQLGWEGQMLAQAIAKVERAITVTINSAQGQWLLNNSHNQSAAELALLYRELQEVHEAIVDRTFVDQGIRWIIDYKSSEPVEGQRLDKFIAAEIFTYRKQLEGYRKLMSQLDNTPIQTALYFVALGHLEVLT